MIIFLTQLNFIPTRRHRALLRMCQTVFACVRCSVQNSRCLEFLASSKATHKIKKQVYDYRNGDFDGLRGALEALNLCNLIQDSDDINLNWTYWKDAFMSAKRSREKTPRLGSQVKSSALCGKKEAARSKLKKSPTDHQQQKYRELCAKAKTHTSEP